MLPLFSPALRRGKQPQGFISAMEDWAKSHLHINELSGGFTSIFPPAPCHVWEVNKAHDILRFWYLLALRGHTGLATTRVESEYKRLKTLISQRNEGQ